MIAWPQRGPDLEASASRVHRWALDHFNYVRDDARWAGDQYLFFGDHWETNAELERDLDSVAGVVHGDCDAFAKLCWMALKRAGERARLVFCTAETGEGHLVCEASGWILDNRQPSIATRDELGNLGYRWISMSGFESGQPWHAIKQGEGQ